MQCLCDHQGLHSLLSVDSSVINNQVACSLVAPELPLWGWRRYDAAACHVLRVKYKQEAVLPLCASMVLGFRFVGGPRAALSAP